MNASYSDNRRMTMTEQPNERGERTPYRRVSKNRRVLRAHVISTRKLSPGIVGVTIGGPDLAHFEYLGADQAFRLFFPRAGQAELRVPPPTAKGWMVPYLRMPAAARPHVRFYTVRAFRQGSLELDLEVVAHGIGAPGSGWASQAGPGDEVGLYDEGAMYTPPSTGGWQLLVGDESAMPAILAILEQQRPTFEACAFIEVPEEADVRGFDPPDGCNIHWLPRNDPSAVPGRLALQALMASELPTTPPAYAYIAGEGSLVADARRFLVRERGVPKARVKFIGYWKHGRASRD
jgi:NADPH-dependent ferric siderophore reductase